MDPRQIQKLARILKAIKRIQNLKKILKEIKDFRDARENPDFQSWMKENKPLFNEMDSSELEQVREQVDYDKDAWNEIVRELRR